MLKKGVADIGVDDHLTIERSTSAVETCSQNLAQNLLMSFMFASWSVKYKELLDAVLRTKVDKLNMLAFVEP